MLNRWTICLLDVMFFPWYEVSGRLHLWEMGLSENRLLLVTTNWERDDQHANLEVSWNRGTPSHHPFLDGVFPNKNQPFLDTPIDGNPHILRVSAGFLLHLSIVLRKALTCHFQSNKNHANLYMGYVRGCAASLEKFLFKWTLGYVSCLYLGWRSMFLNVFKQNLKPFWDIHSWEWLEMWRKETKMNSWCPQWPQPENRRVYKS